MAAEADPPVVETPELAGARAAFAAGNFRGAGELARAAREAAPRDRPEVVLEADTILSRLAPDPLAKQLLVVCALGFVLTAWLTLR